MADTTPIKQLFDKNSDGTKIAFNPQTSSDAVMIYDSNGNQVTLTEYLSNLKTNLNITDGTNGKDGKSFGTIKVQYGVFTATALNISDVENSSNWLDTVPTMTDSYPALWKRWKIVTILADGSYTSPSKWNYEFCGYKGSDGKDAAETQTIYKNVSRNSKNPGDPLAQYAVNGDTSAFINTTTYQSDLFCPDGWSSSAPDILSNYVIYVSTREKDPDVGTWGAYTYPTLWGLSGEDAEAVYIYIAYCNASSPPTSPSSNASIDPVGYQGAQLKGAGGEWSFDQPEDLVDSGLFVYQSVGVFGATGAVRSWSAPVRATGPKGDDGEVVERVYQATAEKVPPSTEILYNYSSPSSDGNYENLWFSLASYWNLDGVNYSYLWMAERTKDSDGNWVNDLSGTRNGWPMEPTLVTLYGHEGVDGDGVQFIYLRLTEAQYKILQDGGHWNFYGVNCTDETGDNSPDLSQLEDSYTIEWTDKTIQVVPKLQSTSSGEPEDLDGVAFTYNLTSINYYTKAIEDQVTCSQVHYTKADGTIGTYFNYTFTYTQQACSNYLVLVINEIKRLELSDMTAYSEAGAYVLWTPTSHATSGILKEIVICKDYDLEITKVTSTDGETYTGDDITSEWQITDLAIEAQTHLDADGNKQDSNFKKYTPGDNLTIDSEATYKIQLIVQNSD